MTTNKRMIISCLMAVLLVVLSACSGSNGGNADAQVGESDNGASTTEAAVKAPSSLVEDGFLTYGTAATYPPFEYMKEEKFTGFDIEFAEAIAAEMGLKVKLIPMNFDGLIPALQGKRIDIINSAMFIKEEREEQVDFIRYMGIGRSIVVPVGNKKGVSSMEDLSGLTVAVTRGAIEEIYVTEYNETLKSDGKKLITVLALPTANDAVLATEQGRADAFIHSSPGAAYLMEERAGAFEIANTVDSGTQIGIAVRKGDKELYDAIEQAVKNVVEKGIYSELMEKYNLPEETSWFK